MEEKADCRRDETGCEPTHSGSYPNMTSLWSPHHLWSVNLSMTVGQEPSLPQLPRLLFAQGRSARACRVGRGANCLCLFRVEMARRGEIPQICRRPGEPERMAVDISSDAVVIDHALRPGADCLGVPTTSAKAQVPKQQQRPQRHLMEIFAGPNCKIQLHSTRMRLVSCFF